MAAHHYTTPDKDFFTTESVDVILRRRDYNKFHVLSRWRFDKNLSLLWIFTEKDTLPPFLCPRLVFSTPQQPASPVDLSKKDTHDWIPGVRDDVLKTYGRLFRKAVGPDFMFMNDNRSHTQLDDFFEEHDIRRTNCL